MKDIGLDLQETMKKNQCSPIYAFLLLEGKQDGIHIYKSQSAKQPNGRLRDTGNQFNNGKGLG